MIRSGSLLSCQGKESAESSPPAARMDGSFATRKIHYMKLVFISDTHSFHEQLVIPPADVLIHCGDLSAYIGTVEEAIKFNEWLAKQPHKHKILVPGNHDVTFEASPTGMKFVMKSCKVLMDEELVIDGIKFYGSPTTPEYGGWAFMKDRGAPIKEVWDKIPKDTDVLITHGPPNGILDEVWRGGNVGCEELMKKVLDIHPIVHAFGHIHEGYGEVTRMGTHFINAACMSYSKPLKLNPPIVVEI